MVRALDRRLITPLLFTSSGHQKIPKDDDRAMRLSRAYFVDVEADNRTEQHYDMSELLLGCRYSSLLCLFHTADPDKTKLSCVVLSVSAV